MGRYYLRHYPHGNAMLMEMTDKEYREVEAEEIDYGEGDTAPKYEPIHWTRAHQWVKDDYPHETPLYIDDGRIKYARDCY